MDQLTVKEVRHIYEGQQGVVVVLSRCPTDAEVRRIESIMKEASDDSAFAE